MKLINDNLPNYINIVINKLEENKKNEFEGDINIRRILNKYYTDVYYADLDRLDKILNEAIQYLLKELKKTGLTQIAVEKFKKDIENIIKWLESLNIKFRPREKHQCRDYDKEQFRRSISTIKYMTNIIDYLVQYEQNQTSEIKKELMYYIDDDNEAFICGWFIKYILDKYDK